MMSMSPFYTSHRIGQLILKRSALGFGLLFYVCDSAERWLTLSASIKHQKA